MFNGDFNWLNIDSAAFERINRTVLDFQATRGNVETELHRSGDEGDAGCGCAYPESVGEDVVQWSNHIMRRLQDTALAFPALTAQLTALPMWLRLDVCGQRIAIVHGDAQSLSGWGFATEMLANPAHQRTVTEWFRRAQVDGFACSHSCLPVFYRGAGELPGQSHFVLNNGAAGMPNFAKTQYGLLTRIATTPYAGPERVLGMRHGPLFLDALALHYDTANWQAQFLAQWPPGSPAHLSYWGRIQHGPQFTPSQAVLDCLAPLSSD